MLKIKIEGLDRIKHRLDRLKEKAQALQGQSTIPIKDLLTNDFMRLHTKYDSLQAMFDQSPFTINSQEDFAAIPDDQWDAYIKANTKFSTWKEMRTQAVEEFLRKRLFS